MIHIKNETMKIFFRILLFLLFLPIVVLLFELYFLGLTMFAGWASSFSIVAIILLGISVIGVTIIGGAYLLSFLISYAIKFMRIRALQIIAKWFAFIVCLYYSIRFNYDAWSVLNLLHSNELAAFIIFVLGTFFLVGYTGIMLFMKKDSA